MSLLGWFSRSPRERSQVKSEAIIRRLLRQFMLPSLVVRPGHWSVVGERRHTYRPSLHMWAEYHQIHLMVACEIIVERGLLPQELLLLLLEDNHRFEDGAFRLVPQDDSRVVVLGRIVDTRTFPEAELRPLGESLLQRMQAMVTKLYGMGLIIAGTESEQEVQRPH
jgi:hypothetical protein